MTDLSSWLTKAETCERLGISPRTLDRRCEDGTGPQREDRPRTGKKPEAVYNPDDVERLSAPKPHVMAENSALMPRPVPAPQSSEVLPLLLDRIALAVERRAPEPAPIPPALYLTLPQASAYTGLTMAFLRRLIKEGQLQAVRDVSLKMRKIDLDNLANLTGASGQMTELAGRVTP